MYLQRLELHGFKSFAQRTVLGFPELKKGQRGITSIAGPNGSGKSNIADAIMWALGEQSLKMLRCKKSEDIIFVGSEKKNRMNLAEVSLYLNNDDQRVPLEYTEIVITRRMYRDGTSEYLMNGNIVRLQDVLFLLAQAQFGQKSYAVIGQGMIDAVLMESPMERKNFFYEATGVKPYQMRYEQAIHKLERTQENLKRTKLTLQELEPHLHSLTRQMKRLEQRQKVEQELCTLQRQYYRWKSKHLEERYQLFVIRLMEQTQKREAQVQEQISLQEKLAHLESVDSRNVLFETLQLEYQKALHERQRLERELSSLQARLELEYEGQGEKDRARLSRHRDDLLQQKEELGREESLLRQQMDSTEHNLNEKQQLFSSVDRKLLGLKEKIQQKEQEMKACNIVSEHELNTELDALFFAQERLITHLAQPQAREDLSQIREEAMKIQSRLEHLRQRVKEASRDVYRKELLLLQQDLNAFLQEKYRLWSELSPIQARLMMFQEKSRIVGEDQRKLQKEISALELQLQQKKGVSSKKGIEVTVTALKKEQEDIKKQIISLQMALDEIEGKMKHFNKEEEEKRLQLIQLQKVIQMKQGDVAKNISEENEFRLEIARLEVHREEIAREIASEVGDAVLLEQSTGEEIQEGDLDILAGQIQGVKHKLELIGGIDEETRVEYEQVKTRYEFLHEQYKDMMHAIDSLHLVVGELEKKIDSQFESSFEKINDGFQHYFQKLFGGGNVSLVKMMAEESLEEQTVFEEDRQDMKQGMSFQGQEATGSAFQKHPSCIKKEKVFVGIDIHACPPQKKVKHINALSGGERSLTSIALICAIIAYNPCPFVVLDEVDAALDESNSEKFADIIEELSHKTQFIVITHNRATMQRSHILYGVTPGRDGTSKLVSLKLEEAEMSRLTVA